MSCDPEGLPPECSEVEDAVNLLHLTCDLCRQPGVPVPAVRRRRPFGQYVPCQNNDDLADLAWRSIGDNHSPMRKCPLAFLVAYLVTSQYSVSTRPLEISSSILALAGSFESYSTGTSFDLSPYPFWSNFRSLANQFSFHGRFMSAHLWQCDDVNKEIAFQGRFVLRAGHDKPETHCA
ncbi:unnamed protein product, partial [Polarella glacialis]